MRAYLAPSLSTTSIAAGKLEYHLVPMLQVEILIWCKGPETLVYQRSKVLRDSLQGSIQLSTDPSDDAQSQ